MALEGLAEAAGALLRGLLHFVVEVLLELPVRWLGRHVGAWLRLDLEADGFAELAIGLLVFTLVAGLGFFTYAAL